MPTQAGQSPQLQALLVRQLAWHLCEASWSACALLCQASCSHFHSRWGLRPQAALLTAPESPKVRNLGRCRLWRRLCLGSMILGDNAESYRVLSEMESPRDMIIRRDIRRTFPGILEEKDIEVLFRVLRSVAHRLEDIGYCQGMNFIVGIFVCVFAMEEATVYQCALSILLRHGMNQYFGERFPKLRLTALQFDCLVEAFFPKLSIRFDKFNLSAEFYASQWFLTLFTYAMPYSYVVRIWDHFFCRGMKFIHRVGLALLQEAMPELLTTNFDSTVHCLRNIGKNTQMSPEELVDAAMQFKVTNRLLSELEHALTASGAAPSDGGNRNLPFCFLERDLDSGRTRWRGMAAPTSTPSGNPSATADSNSDSFGFLDNALPAPRIPTDPSAPSLDSIFRPRASPQADSVSTSKKRHQRLKALKSVQLMPKGMMKQLRVPLGGSADKAEKTQKGDKLGSLELSTYISRDSKKGGACRTRSTSQSRGLDGEGSCPMSARSANDVYNYVHVPEVAAGSTEPTVEKTVGSSISSAIRDFGSMRRSSSVPTGLRQPGRNQSDVNPTRSTAKSPLLFAAPSACSKRHAAESSTSGVTPSSVSGDLPMEIQRTRSQKNRPEGLSAHERRDTPIAAAGSSARGRSDPSAGAGTDRDPEGNIPPHLRHFAVRDLDTGEWKLLDDAQFSTSSKQKSKSRRFSPARRLAGSVAKTNWSLNFRSSGGGSKRGATSASKLAAESPPPDFEDATLETDI